MDGIVFVLGVPKTAESRSFLQESFPDCTLSWCRWSGDISEGLREVGVAPMPSSPAVDVGSCDFLVVNFAVLAEDQRRALRRLLRTRGRSVLCVGVSSSPDDCLPALACGARAFLAFGESVRERRRAIRSAIAGGIRLSPCAVDALLAQVERLPVPFGLLSAKLSPREQEILRMLSAGVTVPEAARCVGVSPHTAYTYVRRLYQKLGVRTRVELARLVR